MATRPIWVDRLNSKPDEGVSARRVEGIAAEAILYHDEADHHHADITPLHSPVMAQESETNATKLSPSVRHLVVVIAET
jgi:hypothetical protein